MSLQPFALLAQYIPPESPTARFYLPHVVQVAQVALSIGRYLGLSAEQLVFLEEASLLHDIGIIRVHDPELGCTGELPYIFHGVEGAAILENEGLPRHARVAARHIGVGISEQDIVSQGLPLPIADYRPETVEEKVIAYADKFFSKSEEKLYTAHTREEIQQYFSERFGEEKAAVFRQWDADFGAGLPIFP